MRKALYWASVILAALALFYPIMYVSISLLRKIPGNPLEYSVFGVLIFGAIAYFLYPEEEEKALQSPQES